MEPLAGQRVTIRPFRPDELDTWLDGLARLDAEAFPGGPPSRARMRGRIRRSGRLEAGQVDLAIEAEGRVVGDIQTQRPPGVVFPPGVYQVGIAIFDGTDRGRGFGLEAMSLLVGWLFGDVGAERVQGGTTPHNLAMRRTFERLGFEVERPIDVFGQRHLLYAVDRERWERSGSR
ncbi:MAG: GNAT family N-acetyltransferase [Actinomycetota bacterium]